MQSYGQTQYHCNFYVIFEAAINKKLNDLKNYLFICEFHFMSKLLYSTQNSFIFNLLIVVFLAGIACVLLLNLIHDLMQLDELAIKVFIYIFSLCFLFRSANFLYKPHICHFLHFSEALIELHLILRC